MNMPSANKPSWWVAVVALLSACAFSPDRLAAAQTKANHPNVLWISLEDTSPDFGCDGDPYAITPVFDRFAESGVRFTRVFTHAPVCAPSRSGIITGMYPTSIATHHMRCQGVPPPDVKCFTEYLRATGYYCTNNAKTDYQFAPPFTAWDENGNQAHWRGRQPGQPFFAVFNFTNTHESQIRTPGGQTKSLVKKLKPEERHDPAKANLPPYYPDTPAVRRDWANYHDNITAVQALVTRVLNQLEEDGLADDTIVWIWGDHGRGLPRGKRWVYDSGIHAPLLIRVPEKWRTLAGGDRAGELRPGNVNEDLIAFVDFAPTVLSLAGIEVPKHLQGRAFLGPQRGPARDYVVAARDRMDERYDLIRAVRDKRFKYIRNFMPHLPYAQRIAYMELMPTMQDWRRLHAEGKLNGAPALFFRDTKPVEELYDTEADPHEVNNLAADPRYADKLTEMRGRLLQWMHETQDLGLIAEPILDEAQRPEAGLTTTEPPTVTAAKRAAADWRREVINDEVLARLLALKEHDHDPAKATDAYERALADEHPAMRYWAVIGLRIAAENNPPSDQTKSAIARLAERDPSDAVRMVAAHTLCRWGDFKAGLPILTAGLESRQRAVQLHAAHALEDLGERARPLLPRLKQLAAKSSEYVQRVTAHTVEQLARGDK